MLEAFANAFNRHDIDAIMSRTASRPLVTGEVTPNAALVFAVSLELLAFAELWHFVNPLSAILAEVMWHSLPVPPWRRTLTGAGVILIATIITFRPLIAHKPAVANRWQQGVCLQTTQATPDRLRRLGSALRDRLLAIALDQDPAEAWRPHAAAKSRVNPDAG